jgi:hypothetical protein
MWKSVAVASGILLAQFLVSYIITYLVACAVRKTQKQLSTGVALALLVAIAGLWVASVSTLTRSVPMHVLLSMLFAGTATVASFFIALGQAPDPANEQK